MKGKRQWREYQEQWIAEFEEWRWEIGRIAALLGIEKRWLSPKHVDHLKKKVPWKGSHLYFAKQYQSFSFSNHNKQRRQLCQSGWWGDERRGTHQQGDQRHGYHIKCNQQQYNWFTNIRSRSGRSLKNINVVPKHISWLRGCHHIHGTWFGRVHGLNGNGRSCKSSHFHKSFISWSSIFPFSEAAIVDRMGRPKKFTSRDNREYALWRVGPGATFACAWLFCHVFQMWCSHQGRWCCCCCCCLGMVVVVVVVVVVVAWSLMLYR